MAGSQSFQARFQSHTQESNLRLLSIPLLSPSRPFSHVSTTTQSERFRSVLWEMAKRSYTHLGMALTKLTCEFLSQLFILSN